MVDIKLEGLSTDDQLKQIILELGKINQQQNQTIEQQTQRIELLEEQLALFKMRFFGRSSEKNSPVDFPEQLSFLETPQVVPGSTAEPEIIEVPAHKRVKRGRKPIPDTLPVVEVLHDIDESEKQCSCGTLLSRIGQEVHKQLDYIPAKLQVIHNIRPKYACKSCEGTESKGSSIKIASPVPQILPKSMASSGLLAHIVVSKFADALPFYRQEKQFERLGYKLRRANMINWTIRLGQRLDRLLEILYLEVLSGPLIHMDETTIQVNKETGRKASSKSYIWAMKGGDPKAPSVYFYYDPSRSKAVAKSLLAGYQAVVMTDGYEAYNFIGDKNQMLHAACWAHARRKFKEVIDAKGASARATQADIAVKYIGKLYKIEKEARLNENITDQQLFFLRQDKAKPVADEFQNWLKELESSVPPKSLFGKAINYTLNLWDSLTLYLSSGFIPIDNNPVENAIRPFAIGRKNFLFCDTPAGAVANARLYSLVETAKANNLNPYEYLKDLFERFPLATTDEQLRSLLPQYIYADK